MVVPAAVPAVSKPEADTVATCGLLLVQITREVMPCKPSAAVATSASWCFSPASKRTLARPTIVSAVMGLDGGTTSSVMLSL